MTRKHYRNLWIALVCTCLALSSTGNVLAADNGTDTAPATHHIQTVFIILMENHNWTGDGNLDIKNNPAAPYINKTLVPMGSHAERYFNPPNLHPSLPNYLWLEAGTNFGIFDDGPPSQHPLPTKLHLVTLLKNANISWKAYLENTTGAVCPLSDSGEYAVRHEPFAYFDDVSNYQNPKSKYCIAHLRPYTELTADLKTGTLPDTSGSRQTCVTICTITAPGIRLRRAINGFLRMCRQSWSLPLSRRVVHCSLSGMKRTAETGPFL